MPNIGSSELLIALVVVILLFGTSRLPKLARSIGEARRELRATDEDNASESNRQ